MYRFFSDSWACKDVARRALTVSRSVTGNLASIITFSIVVPEAGIECECTMDSVQVRFEYKAEDQPYSHEGPKVARSGRSTPLRYGASRN